MHRGAFQILFSYFHGIFLKPKFSFIPIWLFLPAFSQKKSFSAEFFVFEIPNLLPGFAKAQLTSNLWSWIPERWGLKPYTFLAIWNSTFAKKIVSHLFHKRISVSMFQWSCGQVFVDLAMFGGGVILGVYNRGVLVTTSPKHSLKSALSPTPPRGPAGCFRP